MQTQALVLESDLRVADLVIQQLRTAGVARVDHAGDGPSGVAMAESFRYRLVCTELLMPRLGGAELCKALRGANDRSALMAVTARVDAVSSLLGTGPGIDDYVLKPLEPQELVRKAQALIAELPFEATPSSTHSPEDVVLGGMAISPASGEIVLEGKRLCELSSAEFELIWFLARAPGRWLFERELIAGLWGLHPPVTLKSLGINLRLLGIHLRGPETGHRYLSFERRRLRLHAACNSVKEKTW